MAGVEESGCRMRPPTRIQNIFLRRRDEPLRAARSLPSPPGSLGNPAPIVVTRLSALHTPGTSAAPAVLLRAVLLLAAQVACATAAVQLHHADTVGRGLQLPRLPALGPCLGCCVLPQRHNKPAITPSAIDSFHPRLDPTLFLCMSVFRSTFLHFFLH